jgi:hypothetical protein
MILHALDIPEETAELPQWLEAHLLGIDLAPLVAELSAVRWEQPTGTSTLEEILGDRLKDLLADGLSVLPTETLKQLLREPTLLLELQVRVVFEGGPYWDAYRQRSHDVDELSDHVWRRVRSFVEADGPDATDAVVTRPAEPRVSWYRHPLIVSLATAAAVVVALQNWQPATPPPVAVAPGWGWDRPGAIPSDVPADVYLTQLADAAQDWFKKRPETPAALAKRIAQFRQGCSTLILAEHRPLSPEDRQWLVEKCRAWAAKLDTHLADAEAGRDVIDVRTEADETINKLITAMRARATKPA